MDKNSLRLELVPMDDRTDAEAPPPHPIDESLATTQPLQRAIFEPRLELTPVAHPAANADVDTSPKEAPTAAEASLDAIEIRSLERPVPKVNAAGAADAYIAQASREYAQGQIDKPLWDRAMTQSNGDASAAAATYINARAVALRIFDRKRRETRAPAAAERNDDPHARRDGVWQRYKVAVVAAAAIVPAAIAAALFMTSRGEEPAAQVAAAKVPAARVAAPAPPATVAAMAAQHAVAKSAQENAALEKKVQELRDAGNYNVMVLYANEWTRKDAGNAAAWDALRAGYVELHQYEDARSAAKRAVQIAPDDAVLWKHLAAVNLDLDDPEAALGAFDQAAARNSVDVDSLHAIALLQTRLGRTQEAKAAFDRAAAASPGDPVTACLRNGVAQMPPARDGYTMSRQVRAIDNRCHGRPDAVAPAR